MSATAAVLSFDRVFSNPDVDPIQEIKWDHRRSEIRDAKGNIVFEQNDVEVPAFWSQTATNVVASKYFYGKQNTPEREQSVASLVKRVCNTIADWGVELGYFNKETGALFEDELTWLMLNQYAAFNSPVWFNCGLYKAYGVAGDSKGGYYYDLAANSVRRSPNHYEYPQCSACFIQSVSDDMDSIMNLAVAEAALFKYGSGTGTDLSTLRSQREELSGGGRPSGPMSFLGIYDKIAGIVKSGGKTRRAAKMNTLKDWHPDLMEFIKAKATEERKARTLIEAGWDGSFNGEAYATVAYQNENLSLRVSDRFMKAVENKEEWHTHWVTKPERAGPAYPAVDVLKAVAEGAHLCGDPGLQYEDTIQKWHTCKVDGPINSSNPCSEYMFLDDSACNLASLNLMKFRTAEGGFNTARFKAAVRLLITAQDIIVDKSSYPTQKIAKNSHLYRPLGLGYANLGAYLMSLGLPYGSAEGRSMAAAITALMHFEAYAQSARMAAVKGPFERYQANAAPMGDVISMHTAAYQRVEKLDAVSRSLRDAVMDTGKEMLTLGGRHGYRNAQVTVLAPTGTIGFMMDCDTTGIEPDMALVKYKLLASTQAGTEGGMIKIVNRSVPLALQWLGYHPEMVDAICRYIDNNDTIEGAPGLKPAHLEVFDCAFKPEKGTRFIKHWDHLKMMAAVQPFLSGAISKTVNMPETVTVADVLDVYVHAWKMGLKAVALYRDGSKKSQPVSTSKKVHATETTPEVDVDLPVDRRERMPNVRNALTHKFEIGQHEGYVTLGFYPDGRLGELFVTMAKEGSTIRGLMDCWATAVSIGLQYGVPFEVYKSKFEHTRFEPSGWCNGGSPIKSCSSLPDYIFRWVDTYLKQNTAILPAAPVMSPPTIEVSDKAEHASAVYSQANAKLSMDAPPCSECGSITRRNGSCFKCDNCGTSMGCS